MDQIGNPLHTVFEYLSIIFFFLFLNNFSFSLKIKSLHRVNTCVVIILKVCTIENVLF